MNAVLYSGLVPLWEGFDEPFHYAYVQWLRQETVLPILGRTPVPLEITRSLDLVPTSYAGWRNLRRGVLFDTYINLPLAERTELRVRLDNLQRETSPISLSILNYEAHQAPLAYALLAPFDLAWAHIPLPSRILRLRLVVSLSSVLLVWLAAFRLNAVVGLPASASLSAVFVVLSSQMFYATVCHIANDWLAVPVWIFLLAESVEFYLRPRTSTAVRLAAWLAVGLLTKAYFLIAVPFVLALLAGCYLQRRLPLGRALAIAAGAFAVAAPWYLRNLLLYRNLAGTQETNGGVPFAHLAAAAVRVPWRKAFLATVRTSFWTANNSLFTFSVKTTAAVLFLLTAGALIYAFQTVRGRLPEPERPVLGGLFCFAGGLIYSTVVTFWFTQGSGISPAPWYVQPLFAPGACLLFIGLSRARFVGAGLAIAILWLWTYVIAATYVAKLVPYYAGFMTGRARLAELAGWWKRLFKGSWGVLDTAALLPPATLLFLTVAVVALALGLASTLSVIAVRRAMVRQGML